MVYWWCSDNALGKTSYRKQPLTNLLVVIAVALRYGWAGWLSRLLPNELHTIRLMMTWLPIRAIKDCAQLAQIIDILAQTLRRALVF